jgi:hypothetical protein
MTALIRALNAFADHEEERMRKARKQEREATE